MWSLRDFKHSGQLLNSLLLKLPKFQERLFFGAKTRTLPQQRLPALGDSVHFKKYGPIMDTGPQPATLITGGVNPVVHADLFRSALYQSSRLWFPTRDWGHYVKQIGGSSHGSIGIIGLTQQHVPPTTFLVSGHTQGKQLLSQHFKRI